MNVYFEGNYWGCLQERDNEAPGREIRLGTGFSWKGRDWQILAVYVCEEGLVADFCGRIEPEEIRAFYEKWNSREEGALSEEEEALLRQENPFCTDFRVEISVNGKKTPAETGCGTSWCPQALRPEDEAAASETDQAEVLLIDAYGLDPESGWSFLRNSFAWRGNAPETIQSLDFIFTEEPVFVSGPHFRMGQGENGRKVEFVHPATGRTYVLTILAQEAETLENRGLPRETDIQKWPGHFQVLYYRVEPEPAEAELTVVDCAQSDQPVYRKQPAAGSVAVVGGADGPTSFFVAGKLPGFELHPKMRTAYSALHYEPEETVEWKIVFRAESHAKNLSCIFPGTVL